MDNISNQAQLRHSYQLEEKVHSASAMGVLSDPLPAHITAKMVFRPQFVC